MKRRSRLAVLLRMARLEESDALRKLADSQRALEAACARVVSEQRQLESSSRARLLSGPGAVAAADLRALDRRAAHLFERKALLELERRDAERRMEQARQGLATTRLRARALEDALQRRQRQEARERERREARQLEEIHRYARQGSGDTDAAR